MMILVDRFMRGYRWIAPLAVLLAQLAATSSALGDTQRQSDGIPADLSDALSLCVAAGGAGPEDAGAWRAAVQAAVQAGEDPAMLEELLRRVHEEGPGTVEIGEILARLRRLVDQDVPVDLMVDRILQGIAKEIPFSRIETVADGLEAKLLEAANIVDGVFPSARADTSRDERRALVNQGVYALNLGVSPAELQRSLSLASDAERPLEEARANTLAMGCLLSAGLTPVQSLQFIETAWQHGYRGSVMIELGQAIALFGQPGSPPPEQLVEGLLHQIRRQAGARDIFQDLERAHAEGDIDPFDLDRTGVAAPDKGTDRQEYDDGDVTVPPR